MTVTDAIPKSLKQAVDSIITSLDDESRNRILESELEDLIRYHHGWGTGIRNDFKLWSNVELLTDCGSSSMHADDASGVIVNAVWYHLHGLPVSKARIENYRRAEDIVREIGVENYYLKIRTKQSSVRDNDQNIYRMLKMLFGINFKQYKRMAAELDTKHPLKNAE